MKRVNGRRDNEGNTHFAGWSRMALPVKGFTIATVAKPNIGENRPAEVVAEVTLLMKCVYSILQLSFIGYLYTGIHSRFNTL